MKYNRPALWSALLLATALTSPLPAIPTGPFFELNGLNQDQLLELTTSTDAKVRASAWDELVDLSRERAIKGTAKQLKEEDGDVDEVTKRIVQVFEREGGAGWAMALRFFPTNKTSFTFIQDALKTKEEKADDLMLKVYCLRSLCEMHWLRGDPPPEYVLIRYRALLERGPAASGNLNHLQVMLFHLMWIKGDAAGLQDAVSKLLKLPGQPHYSLVYSVLKSFKTAVDAEGRRAEVLKYRIN